MNECAEYAKYPTTNQIRHPLSCGVYRQTTATATMPDQLTNKRIASTDHSRPHTKHTYKHARSYGKLLHTDDDGRTNGQTSVISIVAGYAEAIHKIPTKHALKKGRRQRRQ